MEKFIRIKDGILKTENLKLVEDDRFGRRYINCYNFPYIPLKEADTIAELIDAYVFVSKSGETHYIYGFDYDMGVKTSGSIIESDEAFKKHLLENGTIYGAIWTSKGLIFVSELKDKDMVLI